MFSIDKFRLMRRTKKGLQNEYREWKNRGYASPSPSDIKRCILLRHSTLETTWVETGTFIGDTTEILAKSSKFVYTIEPDDALYKMVYQRFRGNNKICTIHGTSEESFPLLLPTLSGDISFWLDGHYSGGITFKGKSNCPIRSELNNIESNLQKYNNITILIDDIRCFRPDLLEYEDYPDIDYLVDWARRNKFHWTIEHDIFIAKTINRRTQSF